MPKRGVSNGRGGRNWDDRDGGRGNYHSEHDNRSHESNIRRVSFKSNPNKIHKNKNNRNWEVAIRNLDDDDIDMGNQGAGFNRNSNNYRGNFRGRGRRDGRVNSPAPRRNFQRKLIAGNSPWYQVTVPFGHKHDKMFLFNTILPHISPEPFVPYFYTVSGNASVFYVDEFSVADKLHNLDMKISLNDGFRLGLKVRPGTPNVDLDSTVLEKMKSAMAGRYNASTKALDLTNFHTDPGLTDVFCALFRPTIFMAAVNIIAENIPDLQALNLNNNKISILDHFKSILKKLPQLKILYLGQNRISNLVALDALSGFPFIELNFQGNPFASKLKEKDIYVREVRKKFPKLQKLDGLELPPTIGFDVPEEIALPRYQASFLCNPEGQTMVRQFLEQYFALYDSDSRQPLLDAYHENAMLSMTAYYGHGQTQSHINRLNSYLPSSRNLMRLLDRDSRRKHLKNGRLQVVSFLNDLPKTQHDPLSFAVDLTIFTPAIIMLTVNGVFKEIVAASGSNKSSVQPIRSFHKTMVIVPQNGGFCIRNDMLFITNATPDQESSCFKAPSVVLSSPAPPPAYPQQVPSAVQPPAQAGLPADSHQQLVQALAMQTSMNLQWSTNCLEQTNWDFQRAVLIFNELHKQGKIPPEAFST